MAGLLPWTLAPPDEAHRYRLAPEDAAHKMLVLQLCRLNAGKVIGEVEIFG